MTLHLPRLPFALDPLIAEAKRRARQRRVLALAALFLVLATGLAFGFRSSGGGPNGGLGITAASARAGALAVPIPPGFHRYDIRAGIYRTGTRPPVIGATLTNYRVPTSNVRLRTRGVLPLHARRNGVVLQVSLWIAIGVTQAPRLQLPLSLHQPWVQRHVPTGTRRYGLLRFHGQDYEVVVWTGRTAPASDRAALLHALASVHPTP
jgi:hypothetical protein